MTRLRARPDQLSQPGSTPGIDGELWAALRTYLGSRMALGQESGFATRVADAWLDLNDDPSLTSADRIEQLITFTVNQGADEGDTRAVVDRQREHIASDPADFAKRRREFAARRRLLEMGV